MGKFGPNKSKLSVIIENWHTWYLEDAGSYSNITFMNFQLQIPFWANLNQKVCFKSKLFVLSKSWHTWHLEDADSYFNICFFNFELKINFLPNLGQKSQICPFCLKIGILGILRMRILTLRLVFWILKPKSFNRWPSGLFFIHQMWVALL